VGIKNLSLAEEYLADHFPGFPVMPGVLMLEALTQAAAWLVRDLEDFAHSVIVLKRAQTIKYGSFVEPGRQLRLQVELLAHGERDTSFKGKGIIDEQVMVQGRFTVTRYNLRERDPNLHTTDVAIVEWLRDLYATLRKGSVGSKAMVRIAPPVPVAALAPGPER
jgi:3-hydroxyacyl-[acyl-carrier-protein] dehydratase